MIINRGAYMRIVNGWASDKGVERSENQDC